VKPFVRSPFLGLVVTGVIASIALVAEAQLSLPVDVHFLFQLVWLGVVSTALLAFAILASEPKANRVAPQDFPPEEDIPEWHDEDRLWLQAHPDSTMNADSR
jgi:hypothetical protein